MRYTLRSKNNGKRWGVWDREKKRWHIIPMPQDKHPSKMANMLPQVIEARELAKKEKARELALSKKKKKTKWISKKQ